MSYFVTKGSGLGCSCEELACRGKDQGLKMDPQTLFEGCACRGGCERFCSHWKTGRPIHIRESIGAETIKLKLKKSLAVALL